LSFRAKLYIAVILAIGFALVAYACANWKCTGLPRHLAYIVAASLAALMRIRIPGLAATYSLASLYVLLAISFCSYSEIIGIGVLSTLVQCCIRTGSRPKALPVLFSIASIVITISIAHYPSYFLASSSYKTLMPLGLAISSGIYYVIDTTLLTGWDTLVKGSCFTETWDKWLLWAFGYHLLGAAIAVILSVDPLAIDWRMPLPVLPLAFVTYYYYREYLRRHVHQNLP